MDAEFNSSAVYISPLNIAIHGIVFKRKKNRVSWLSFIEKSKAYLGNMKAAKTIFIHIYWSFLFFSGFSIQRILFSSVCMTHVGHSDSMALSSSRDG